MAIAQAPSIWEDARLAARLIAIDPAGLGGAVLRGGPGPARARWLDLLGRCLPPGAPMLRVPLHVEAGRLLGGLDLAATLKAGRPVSERGLLASADGGVLLLSMAERITAMTAAQIASALDTGDIHLQRDGFSRRDPARFGVIALDEALEDEDRPPAALAERLAFEIDLRTLSHRDLDNRTEDVRLIVGARAALATVEVDDALIDALTGTALALGIGSLRAPLLAYRTARAAAALAGRIEVTAEDADLAARLVLAHRATSLPEGSKDDPPEGPEDEEAPPDDAMDDTPPPGTDDDANPAVGDRPLEDRLLEAALAALPKGLLDSLRLATGARPSARSEGKAGIVKKNGLRGRPAGVRPGKPGPGQRLSVIETLRAAAPLQTLRRRERPAPDAGPVPSRIEVRASDFRVVRQKQRSRTTAIFAVDASGSSALERLAEAKGAVELLLAECYVRRDQVALLAFRGEEATLLLPPTRSLLRAKRCLAGLPGGGGTPLAAGIEAALLLADAAARRGETPVLVFLTDGRANIARSGRPGRKQAAADALALANKARFAGYTALMIDISARPAGEAAVLAEAMAARYLPLPRADAGALSAIVTSALRP